MSLMTVFKKKMLNFFEITEMSNSCFLVSKQERSCIRHPGDYIFMFLNSDEENLPLLSILFYVYFKVTYPFMISKTRNRKHDTSTIFCLMEKFWPDATAHYWVSDIFIYIRKAAATIVRFYSKDKSIEFARGQQQYIA